MNNKVHTRGSRGPEATGVFVVAETYNRSILLPGGTLWKREEHEMRNGWRLVLGLGALLALIGTGALVLAILLR